MIRNQNRVNKQTLRQQIIADLTTAGIAADLPGVHQALLGSIQMEPVWHLLLESAENFSNQRPAASLVFTLGGLLRGPHRTQLKSESERRNTAERINKLCASLACEIAALRDRDLGLPLPIHVALEETVDSAFESWEQDYLMPSWTSALLGMTDALECQVGTRKDWMKLAPLSIDGARDTSFESVRRSLKSEEAKECEEVIRSVMESLKQDTEAWLQRSFTTGLEPLLWALQDGIREWEKEPQLIQKPNDESEQWAYVIRGVHYFFRKHFKKSMPRETAIVVRSIQDSHEESSALTESRVCAIVSSRKKIRS